MTLEQAAERLRCSVKTVRRRIASGDLRASRIGRGIWEIREADLEDYLDRAAVVVRESGPVASAGPLMVAAAPRTRRRRQGGRLVVPEGAGRPA